MSGSLSPLNLCPHYVQRDNPSFHFGISYSAWPLCGKKINALPLLWAKRSTGVVTGFRESSGSNQATSKDRHQNFRFARIHEITCPSVRQDTTQNTWEMWNSLLAPNSACRLNFGVRRFGTRLCLRLQRNMKQAVAGHETSFLSTRMKTEIVQRE
jgi:hypothetical protein